MMLRGRVTAVNADGTCQVTIPGRAYPYASVANTLDRTIKEGEAVLLETVGGDKQKPYMVASGGYYSVTDTTVTNI